LGESRLITLDKVNSLQQKYSLIEKRLVRGTNSKPKYQLTKTLQIQLSNNDVITIPKGFVWDLSSVPRFLWWLLPPDGDFDLAYLIHDYLWIKMKHKYTQKFTDYEMLKWSKKTNGTKKLSLRNIDNYLRFIFVRLFGWMVWKNLIKIN